MFLIMINFEFADNAQLRFNETEQLPIAINNTALYFMIIDQDNFGVVSYNCDVRALNNLHKALSIVEGHENVIILCNWKGLYQSHTFVCDKDVVLLQIKNALGDSYTDELESNLAY